MNLSSRTIAFANKTIEFLSKTLDAWMSIQSQYLSHARVCFRGGFREHLSHHFFSLDGYAALRGAAKTFRALRAYFFDNNIFDIILFYKI